MDPWRHGEKKKRNEDFAKGKIQKSGMENEATKEFKIREKDKNVNAENDFVLLLSRHRRIHTEESKPVPELRTIQNGGEEKNRNVDCRKGLKKGL